MALVIAGALGGCGAPTIDLAGTYVWSSGGALALTVHVETAFPSTFATVQVYACTEFCELGDVAAGTVGTTNLLSYAEPNSGIPTHLQGFDNDADGVADRIVFPLYPGDPDAQQLEAARDDGIAWPPA